jgi:hypothetical protein
MVAPLIIAAGVAAAAQLASAGMQWLNSKDAQRASERERQRMAGTLNAIQDPNFDTRNLDPEALTLLQKYVPETTNYIEEVAPQTVKAQMAGAVAGRQAQMDALGKFRQLMTQGYDPQTAMEMARAQRGASAEAASARQTAQLESARRGFGGGPSFYQAGAGAQAQDRLAQAQQAALADAAQRRMQATGQYANLGGQIRGEDVNLERGNIDIINAYNQRMANSQRDWANRGADIRNAANLRNISEAQRIDEQNKANRYNAAVANQGRQNTTAQLQFTNSMSRATGQMPIAQWGEQNAQNNAAQQNAAWQAGSDLASKGVGVWAQQQQNQEQRDWEREKLNRMYPEKG